MLVGGPQLSRRTESPFSNLVKSCGKPRFERLTSVLPEIQLAVAVGAGFTDRAPNLEMSIPSVGSFLEDTADAIVIAPDADLALSAIDVAVIVTTAVEALDGAV